MEMKRFLRHVAMTPLTARRCFPDRTMDAVAAEIGASEKRHRGEIVFVVEAELSTEQLWRGLRPRDRALEVFASHGTWNTEENNGVLVYVLLADRAVEIVADRGIDRHVGAEGWRAIVEAIDSRFRAGRFEEGALEGVRAVSAHLERHFPEQGEGRNQLGDRPIRL